MRIFTSFLLAVGLSLTLFSCSHKNTDDDDREEVVIDIRRTPDSDTCLTEGTSDGMYSVDFSIPEQQGSYTHMAKAQLLAVLTEKGRQPVRKIIADNITSLPATVPLDIARIYAAFDKTVPETDDILTITPNVVYDNGDIDWGWDQGAGYKHADISWTMGDGTPFSHRVEYLTEEATPIFNADRYTGTALVVLENGITLPNHAMEYTIEVTKLDLTDPLNQPLTGDMPDGVALSGLSGYQLSGPILYSVVIDAPASVSFNLWVINKTGEIFFPRDQQIAISEKDVPLYIRGGTGEVDTEQDQFLLFPSFKMGVDIPNYDIVIQF